MEIIKEFIFKSTSSSLKERKKLFEGVYNVLENRFEHNLPSSAYKVLAKTNYYLFPLYIDKLSKESLIKLNHYLIEIDYESSLKIILSSLEIHSKNLIGHPNRSSSMLSLYGQDILNGIIKSSNSANIELKAEIGKISKIYSNFTLITYSFNCGKYLTTSYKKLKLILNEFPSICSFFISSLINETEDRQNNLLFLGYLLKYLFETDKSSQFLELKSSITKIYIESMIESRLKIDLWLIQSSNFFLKYVTSDDFKNQFLPEIKRSLLRNPEVIMQRLAFILKDLDIELDEIFSELIPSLTTQLISKDEIIQIHSIEVFKVLSNHCRNFESLQSIIKNLFNILNSNQVKLLTGNQKHSILAAIGNSYSSFLSASQDTVIFSLNCFKEYLKTETNEAIIINSFQQTNNLLKNFKINDFSNEAILKIREFFKIQLDVKSYTNNIRSNIFRIISSIFWPEKLRLYLRDFEKPCVNSLEKAHMQVTSNNWLNNEALSASLILTLMPINNLSKTSNELEILILIDSKKIIFTDEKFLCSLNENGLSEFILLFEQLLKINSDIENKFDLR